MFHLRYELHHAHINNENIIASTAVLCDVEIVSDGDTSEGGRDMKMHNNQPVFTRRTLRCVRKLTVMQVTTLEINRVSSLLNPNYQFHKLPRTQPTVKSHLLIISDACEAHYGNFNCIA